MFPAGNLAALGVYPDELALSMGRDPWGTVAFSLLHVPPFAIAWWDPTTPGLSALKGK